MSLLKGGVKPRERRIEGDVNLTSFLDILTVLIFFLIQMFGVSSKGISIPNDIDLPIAEVKSMPEKLLTLSISPHEIKVNGILLMTYDGSKFPQGELGGDGRALKKLEKLLKAERSKGLKAYESFHFKETPPGKIMIQADREIPFRILKYIFYTATVSGYMDYQFLIKKGSNST